METWESSVQFPDLHIVFKRDKSSPRLENLEYPAQEFNRRALNNSLSIEN